MKTFSAFIAAAVLCLGCVAPAAAQPVAASDADVFAQPAFVAITQAFSAEESLELAAHLSVVLRQYERAIPMFEVLLERSPNRAELWAALAAAYNNADEPREALDAADIAVTLAPHYPHFYAERGIAAFRLDMHPRAIEDLKHYLEAFPSNARAHFYLGLAQAAHEETEAARASLLRARRLNPDLATSTDYYLGLIAARRGQTILGRELLARAKRAFEGSDLPVTELVARQLQDVDGAISRHMRAAMHESDARIAGSVPTR